MSSDLSGPVGPEYLGPEPKQRSAGSKRPTLVAASVVAVLAAAGAGGWGAYSLLSGGGPAPATAVPANAVGYVSIDLDPSASQKIEALQTLKKFPGLAKQMKIGSQDDLRRWVLDQAQKNGTCTNLDYDKDFAPWIGDRVAVAGVPSGSAVNLELAVQVSDQVAARKAVSALDKCSGSSGTSGVAFAGDYMVISDNQEHADQIAAAAKQSALQDDPTFQKWTGAAGDPGVVTMYASPQAPQALIHAVQRSMQGSLGGTTMLPPAAGMNQLWKAYGDKYKNFQGGAAVLRFHDGAFEAEVVSGGMPTTVNAGSAADIENLPASTAAAFGIGLPHGWTRSYIKQMAPMVGGEQQLQQLMKQGSRQTGLNLPGDIDTLLGNGFSVALDSSADFAAVNRNQDPSLVPAGIRIKGDPTAVDGVLGKLRKVIGPQASMLKTKDGNGVVAVGLNQKYVDSLAGNGTLGSDPTFTSVVPHADQSTGVLYVNFDAGNGWANRLADTLSHGDPTVKANVAPLHALGISGWTDGGVSHALFRLPPTSATGWARPGNRSGG